MPKETQCLLWHGRGSSTVDAVAVRARTSRAVLAAARRLDVSVIGIAYRAMRILRTPPRHDEAHELTVRQQGTRPVATPTQEVGARLSTGSRARISVLRRKRRWGKRFYAGARKGWEMQSIGMAKLFGDREDPRVRLQALFGGSLPSGGQPPEPAVVWAQDVLSRNGSTETHDIVTKVRELRKAERRLTLKSATFLAQHVGP